MLRPICYSFVALIPVLFAACSRSNDDPSTASSDAAAANEPGTNSNAAATPIEEPTSQPAAAPPATAATEPAQPQAPVKGEPPVAADDSQPDTTDPAEIVGRIADFYKQVQSLQVNSEHVMSISGPGMNNQMTAQREVAVERPNRIAIRTTEGMSSFEVVSDGEELTTSMPMLQRYSTSTAPESFDELLSNPLLAGGMMGGQGTFVVQLIAEDPYERIAEGVTEAQYIGTEELNGTQAHHLRFIQDQFDWDMWTPVAGDPVVLQISTDMSKAMSQFGGAAQIKDMQMTSIERLTDWTFNATIDAEAFVFTAPDGAEKVDSLFGGMGGGAEEPSPLLGEPAPPIQLALLDGGSLDLGSHAGESVVMLDFWATWCGPCVEEMPVLAKVAAEYRDKGVAFYAVNQAEDPDDIRAFLEEQDLSITVALDAESEAAEGYGVRGIPTLVLIDQQGTVQSVHVGYSPTLEETLHQELDDLLAGKSLVEETLASTADEPVTPAQAQPEPETEPASEGLEEVWSVDGRFASVAADQSTGTIYAVNSRGKCTSFSPDGEQLNSFEAPHRINVLRPAKLTAGSGIQLIGFAAWGDTVLAMNSDGGELWNETGGQGIDDVWAADLDDDGQDEVIVGYNGGTGLHVFSMDGARLWEYNQIGNVWHVAAGNVTGDEGVEVVTTSAAGRVHLFDADGNHLRDVEPPLYANMVRVGKLTPDAAYASIIVVGGSQMVALKGTGSVVWSADLPASDHCDSLEIATGTHWAAAGLRVGGVAVVDTSNGKVIAKLGSGGARPDVAWHTADEAPLLLVATGTALKALRVTPDAGE